MKSNWVVSIHDTGIGDAEPFETGPYSKKRAEEIAEAFNRTHEGKGWFAGAYPLSRYTVPQLRSMFEDNSVPDHHGEDEVGYSSRSGDSF